MKGGPNNPNAKKFPDGTVRQGQVVTTFGPGAMLDLLNDAVLVGGLDFWSYDRSLQIPYIAEDRLRDWQFTPNGTEGFAKAEVTIGGVSTADLSSKTMESKRVRGLHFIGEAVDVTGWLGGYNFQWAWASAHAAAQAL